MKFYIKTRNRLIKTKIPAPGTGNLVKKLSKIESRSMHGQVPIAWEKAENLHKKVTKVRLLFQDYATIPAQKGLLAKKSKIREWSNVRPPLKSINNERVLELANILNKEFGYSY